MEEELENEIEFMNAEDLLEYLRLSKEHWLNRNPVNIAIPTGWIFRGQSDAN